jgi:molybdopterin-containing oxidoreductase family iron-sulfur binding subunit
MERREFLLTGGLVAGGAAVAMGAVVVARLPSEPKDPVGAESVRKLDALKDLAPRDDEDVLIRMQRELARAMAKPAEQRHWIMVIDLRKCVGCYACTIGCVAENKLPPGVVYRPVTTEEIGTFPNIRLRFTPRPCMHCNNPSCVPVCPVKATWKRPDGVVVVDYDKCIGCRYCLNACPYNARTSDFGRYYESGAGEGAPKGEERPLDGPRLPYQHEPSYEYGKNWKRDGRQSPVGNARKCHFCLHRLEAGKLPVCVTTCIGRATFFGDEHDPESLVVELKTRHDVQTLIPHSGNDPQCFYIV